MNGNASNRVASITRSDTFTTTRGYTLPLKPVSSFLIADIKRLVPIPEPPTYTVKTVTGEEQTFPHDETTLASDEDRDMWAKYTRELRAASGMQMSKLTEVLLMDGVELPEPPPTWGEKMVRLGLTLPSDPYEFRKFYLERELLGSASEAFDLVLAIMARSQDVPEEMILIVQDQFKSGMEEYKAGLTRDALRKLELLKSPGSGDHGEGLGKDSE